MTNRVYETMTRILLGGFTIRIWRAAADLDTPHEEDITLKFSDPDFRYDTRFQIAEQIEKFEGVAAYEILDHAGNGVVCYPDWS